MSAPTVVAPPSPRPEAATAPPVRWRALALLVVLALLPVAWLVVGHRSSLAQGAYSATGGLRTATDGIRDTRLVAPPQGAEVVVTVRNDGPVPVTVHVPDEEHAVHFLQVLGLRPTDRRSLQPREGAPLRDRVRLGRGEEAAVTVRVGIPRCTPYAAGSSAETDALPLRVDALGLTTVQRAPLPLPFTVVGPAPGC